jgi:hypothetical protein
MSAALPLSANWDESRWARLLARIQNGDVIPLVGSNLTEVYCRLRDKLIQQYGHKVGIEGNTDAWVTALSLPQVVSLLTHCRDAEDDEELAIKITELKTDSIVPESLQNLASIDGFDLYLTTSFDGLLERALEERYPERIAPIYFTERSRIDLSYRKPDAKTLFYLFGKMGETQDYGCSEERILRLSHRLQKTEHQQPTWIFDRLRDENTILLMIGSDLPDWVLRHLMVAVRGAERIQPGKKFKDFATPNNLPDRAFVQFLEHLGCAVYPGSISEFAQELASRWQHRPVSAQTSVIRPATSEDDARDVFISYATPDRASAILVRDALKAYGLSTWLDVDDFKSRDTAVIADVVENRCRFFLPLGRFSRSCLARLTNGLSSLLQHPEPTRVGHAPQSSSPTSNRRCIELGKSYEKRRAQKERRTERSNNATRCHGLQ